ncbi:hypothetical protein RFI_24478 [Reticulomyxa filosa]|uniref:Uncharacterized protein n=1 Tax=Reticulomyxa filosa TaxID=46433 RepID=X6MGZ6_RETFI|nr:hypothetical protein RFI_24478 [Reticulomyxa filosa]|eukprot:ETO12896.1 hypothetical protein RFI_24478 [Reticulomyxa filosa]
MSIRPGRLVDYFVTVGLPDLNNLVPYHGEYVTQNLEEMGLNEIKTIRNLRIIRSNKPSEIPDNYYCLSQSLEGHFVGVDTDNWFGKFGKSKTNGPFIAFERADHQILAADQDQNAEMDKMGQETNEKEGTQREDSLSSTVHYNNSRTSDLYPITKLCIRDVTEYLKLKTNKDIISSSQSQLNIFLQKKKCTFIWVHCAQK